MVSSGLWPCSAATPGIFSLAFSLAVNSPTVARPLEVGFRSTFTHSATSPPELSMICEH